MNLLFEPLIDKSIHTNSFLKKYQYDQSNSPSDIDYVTDIAKKAKNNKLRIHKLTIDSEEIGFIAFSVNKLNNSPCLFVEYIFISSPYRKMTYSELGDTTLGEQLLQYSNLIATSLDRNVPIIYIALEPANEKLKKYYDKKGFTKLDKTDILFAKVIKA